MSALFVMLPRAARGDVADFLGRTVVSVKLQTEQRDVADSSLLQVVETHVGRPLSMIDVRESVTHLFSFGRFEDVRVHAGATAGGVALLYDLVPIHPVDRIVFTGARVEGVDAGRLRKAVVERYGASPPVGRTTDLARVVEDGLRQRGYLHPSVRPRAELRHGPDRATLVFAIDPGARTRIGRLDVSGRLGMSTSEVLRRLGLVQGAPYERQAIDSRIERYVEDRRSRGFLEAKLSVTASFADEDRLVNLAVAVDQGPHVRVVFNGDSVPADRREELVPVVREGSADEDLLEDSSNRIEEFFRAQGYRDAAALHSREPSEDELLITFTVHKGSLYRVARFEVSGNAAVPLADLLPVIRTREGQPFVAARLDSDEAALENYYHRQGFAAAGVRVGVEPMAGAASSGQIPVIVQLIVSENVRTIVTSVTIQGSAAISAAELRSRLALQSGGPFIPAQLAADRDTIQLRYADLGYQSSTVESNPGLSSEGTRADIVFKVNEGPQIRVDHVLIVGNVRTQTATIVRELRIKPGDPLGLATVNDSQRRLTELGLFRRVRITEVPHGEAGLRDVLVTVEEAPPTSIGYGGGAEAAERTRTDVVTGAAVQQLEFAPRAFFEIGRRNLFGGNRSVNLFTRISLTPRESETASGRVATGGYGFSEYRVLTTFREPHVVGTTADAFLTGVAEQQRRASFNFARKGFSAEVGRRITPRISVTGNYQIQRVELFDVKIDPSDKLLVDRLFPQVLLSSFSLSVIDDTRSDTLNPTSGRYLSANGQLAARDLGSAVGFAKSYFTAQVFRLVPHARGAVLAASARLGMAAGFPRPAIDDQGNPTTVRDLPASERFFAGGDTTVRGFTLDQLGSAETIDKDGFPIGGSGVVILNAELRTPALDNLGLRIPVLGNFGVVGFVDTGNVFARTSEIDFGEFRSAVGFGIRYKSPVGPFRVDLGFKVRREDIAGKREPLTAWHVSFGQAF